jgi:hypothetical protein
MVDYTVTILVLNAQCCSHCASVLQCTCTLAIPTPCWTVLLHFSIRAKHWNCSSTFHTSFRSIYWTVLLHFSIRAHIIVIVLIHFANSSHIWKCIGTFYLLHGIRDQALNWTSTIFNPGALICNCTSTFHFSFGFIYWTVLVHFSIRAHIIVIACTVCQQLPYLKIYWYIFSPTWYQGSGT